MGIRDAVRRTFWELRARDVDRRYGGSLEDTAALTAALAERRPASVLEVGCGAGRLVPLYERYGVERVVGIDVAERAVRLARSRHPGHRFVRAPAEELPDLGRFDLAVTFRTLQHVPPAHVEAATAGIARSADAVFLQEQREGAVHAYLFVHEYEALLAAHGFDRVRRDGDAALYVRS